MDEELLHSETGYGDLESIWRGIQAEREAMGDLDAEEEYGKFDSSNFGGDGLGDWNLTNGRLGADPPVQEYLFEEENIFQAQGNPFEEGVRIMNEGGNLSLAALAFEAAVQKNPDHVDAWVYLGLGICSPLRRGILVRAGRLLVCRL